MVEISAPIIVVNFKVYAEAEGDNAIHLARICNKVSSESDVSIIVCPPMVELSRVVSEVNMPVFSQNIDPCGPGPNTGFITPSSVKATGAYGSLINHSEHEQAMDNISTCVSMCKALDLKTCVCAGTSTLAKQITSLSPNFIALEPSQLIGGDISATEVYQRDIHDTVYQIKNINKDVEVLCGAGIRTGNDVKAAIDLGASGVLVASGILKAKDPELALRGLIKYI